MEKAEKRQHDARSGRHLFANIGTSSGKRLVKIGLRKYLTCRYIGGGGGGEEIFCRRNPEPFHRSSFSACPGEESENWNRGKGTFFDCITHIPDRLHLNLGA